MKRFPFLLLIGIALLLVAWPVSAMDNTTTISFSDLNWITHSNIEIHGLDPNGTWILMSIQNTTSEGIVFQPGVYSLVVRPSSTSWFGDPIAMFSYLTTFFETYWLQIFVMLGIFIFVLRQANK